MLLIPLTLFITLHVPTMSVDIPLKVVSGSFHQGNKRLGDSAKELII